MKDKVVKKLFPKMVERGFVDLVDEVASSSMSL